MREREREYLEQGDFAEGVQMHVDGQISFHLCWQ